ncbi:MAG: aspartate aminotransferase family protein, partial [Pseudomonadota bacterium]
MRGRGCRLWDAQGQKYLDLAGSAAVNLIGHGVQEISAAMARQARQLEFVHSSQFTTRVAEEFAAEVLEFAGPAYRGGSVYFTCGGSEAVETALKLARQYQVEIGEQQRFRILSRKQSYHGATLGAIAVGGNLRRRELYLPMARRAEPFEQVNPPYCYRCRYACKDCARRYSDEVAEAIAASRGEAAAFIFEPASGATLGGATPPSGYVERVAAVCRRAGVLLIADEVMTGFGRTGRNFAVEHWQVAPDILVCGKGIASGYAPLGAVIAKRHVVQAIARGSGAFVHGFTYNA